MVAQPAIRLPVPTLALGAIGPAVAVGGGFAGAWFARSSESGMSALAGAGVATLAAVAWSLVVALLKPRPAGQWSLVMVLGSSGRLMASLAIALGVFVATRPAEGPFWGTFLAASLAALVVETLVSISALKRLAGSPRPAEEPLR